MRIQLPLFTSFLRTHFAKTRFYLAGKPVKAKNKLASSLGRAKKSPKKVKKSLLAKTIDSFLLTLACLCLLAAAVLTFPNVYYQIFPADIEPIVSLEAGTPLGGKFEGGVQEEIKQEIPEKNDNLPEGNWLIIPRIDVRTKLRATADPSKALAQGVWMSPEYGHPLDEYELPIILAAHRFGWEWWWQSEYWKYNSFYNLPELEPGDLIEIIVDQRKWTYEIYAGEQGEEITDYEADLILYTCQFLNSPVRHFRYARLINLDKNSQE